MITETQTTQELTFTRVLNAPSSEVFRAFTSAAALRGWLCNAAQIAAHRGGRVYLWWNDGYYVVGEYTDFQPNKALAFTWNGRGEAVPGEVRVELSEEGNSTKLRLAHSGVGTAPESVSEVTGEWERSLENLQSFVETGVDLRLARRPMFGISGAEEMNSELAARLGSPVTEGLYLEGVVDGMGAKAAGLGKGDVVVSLGDRPITGYESLASALDGRQAGDRVPVSYYRGQEHMSVTVELSARPRPDVPATAQALATQLREAYRQLDKELDDLVVGISDEEASSRPSTDDWCGKEVLAHLIAVEQDVQMWIAALAEGDEPENVYHSNNLLRLQAITSVYPTLSTLAEEQKRTGAVTLAMLETLPDKLVAHKADWYDLAYSLIDLVDHRRSHYTETKMLAEAAHG